MDNSANFSWIVMAKRTPVLKTRRKWRDIKATELGAAALKNLLPMNVNAKTPYPDYVMMGTYASYREAQNPAKEACVKARLGYLNAVSVNKVCNSGLASVMIGDALIKSGGAHCVIAGGMENLLAFDKIELLSLLKDPKTEEMTWHAGDWCAKTFNISRKDQDDWAVESYKRAREACWRGAFKDELFSFQGQDSDEEPFWKVDEKIIRSAELMPGCETITALNSSKNAGGAAAVMLMNKEFAIWQSYKPLACILNHASVALGRESRRFTIAPPTAIKIAVSKAGLGLKDIDLYFINTAFSSVMLYASRNLNIPLEKININGDAVSIGHPIGATGAKLLVEAVWALRNQDKHYAVVCLCNAPAEAMAMVIESL